MKNNDGPVEGWPWPRTDAEWFRVGAAARYLSARGYTISPRTLGRWCTEPRIPSYKPPAEFGHRRIASTTLDHIIALADRGETISKMTPKANAS